MTISEIPLSPENQRFSISVAGQSLQMAVTWRAAFWCLDIMDSSGADTDKGDPAYHRRRPAGAVSLSRAWLFALCGLRQPVQRKPN